MSDDQAYGWRRLLETALTADLDFRRVGLYAILVFLIAFFLTPIEAGFVTSLKTDLAVTNTEPVIPPGPGQFTTENWQTAFDILGIGMVNSLLFAVPATVISALLGSLAAYGLTQIDWRGQLAVLVLFLVGIFIPYQAVLVPLSRLWSTVVPLEELLAPIWALPLLQTHHADLLSLVITHVAYGIPICTILFRSYYQTISPSMTEAARLDGASVARIYRRIMLPLSAPMFAVVLIYQFTQIWNDLLFALILVSSQSDPAAPVTLILSGLGTSLEGIDFGLRMAGAFITAVPTLVVYVLFGEQFAEGVAT